MACLARAIAAALREVLRSHVDVARKLWPWPAHLHALACQGPTWTPEDTSDTLSDSDSELGHFANDGLDWYRFLGHGESPEHSADYEARIRACRQSVLASLTPDGPPVVRRSPPRVRFQLDDEVCLQEARATIRHGTSQLEALFPQQEARAPIRHGTSQLEALFPQLGACATICHGTSQCEALVPRL